MERTVKYASLLLSIVGLTACGSGGVAGGEALRVLPSHIPGIVARSTLTGTINPEQEMTLRVVLPMRDSNSLDASMSEAANPQSAAFTQVIEHNAFVSLYLPTQDNIAQVRAALTAAGLTPEADAHGSLLNVTGRAANVEAFFHTQINTYVDPNGFAFFAPAGDVSVDSALPIAGASGLATMFPAHSSLAPRAAFTPGASGLKSSDIRALYNIPSNMDGSGQTIGIVEVDGYAPNDIAEYCAVTQINQAPRTNILIDNMNGGIYDATDNQLEVTLDIEIANAMAPNAAQIRVYEGNINFMPDIYNEVANPNIGDNMLINMVSSSWAQPEDTLSQSDAITMQNIFKQMAAQGQTMFASSGDYGSDGIQEKHNDTNWPAASSYVIAVGGTTISRSGDSYVGEQAWPGSGGGVSKIVLIPSWQVGAFSSNANDSTTMRNVPDVALNADPNTGYLVYLQGAVAEGAIGGTSASAPLWAAFGAIINQARANKSLPAMGFLAPPLYFVGTGGSYTSNFHDITLGNNGSYSAVVGDDLTTGFGTLNGSALLTTFSSAYARATLGEPSTFAPSNPP
jgi:subtilase family serine protease